MYTAEALDNKVLCLAKEDEYKDYMETAKTGIIYLDNTLRIKNINREAERICSVERAKVLGSKADVTFKHYGEKFLKILALTEYEEYTTANLKLKNEEHTVYIHVDALKLREPTGLVSGVIIILQDMSSVRAAIKQIHTTQMLMSLGELAAGVAHHVRTPLTTIGGYLQVMLSRLQDDQYTVRRDVLEMLLEEVSYINNVVKELILFAKPPVNKEPGIDINKIIEESLLLTFKEMGGEKISINKQLTAKLPVINADINLMKQAIVNIMQNSLEAMPGEGVLAIKTWLNADLNMLVIAISDTGTGVSPEILPRVFEPFYTTKLDRMGLGLPIAHRIVTEHNGFLNITCEEKKGTKVHIYLPIIERKTRHLSVVHQQILNLQ